VPAGGASVVWVYALQPGAPAGYYTANIFFIGYYDNGRTFETPAFPVALEVSLDPLGYGCPKAGDLDVCPGTASQGNRACATP
jgi:hypothetical protein